MEYSSIVIALCVLFLLQIIFIVIALGTRAALKKLSDKLAATPTVAIRETAHHNRPHHDRDRDRERDRVRPDSRARRPQEQQPSAPLAPEPPTREKEQVENSLRDINLRLKNAEREQEQARQSFKQPSFEPTSPAGPIANSGSGRFDRDRGERNDRGNMGGDRGRGRDSGRPPREANRDPRDRGGNRNDGPRNNYQRGGSDQNRQAGGAPRPPVPPQPPEVKNETSSIEVAPVKTNIAPTLTSVNAPVFAAVNPPPPPVADILATDAGISNDAQLEHGRKTQVKRRVLPNGQLSSDSTDSDNTDSSVNKADDTGIDPSSITFGRR